MNHDPAFATTRWTRVVAAQETSGSALGELCTAYYAPVHVYIVGAAHDLGDPRDLTQEFFARLLRGSMIHGADRTKGRFRSYLLGAVKHFLADMYDRRRAAKRGAQYEHITLAPDTDTSPGIDIPDRRLSDAWFDREWGLAVLALALETLAKEHTATDKNTHFHVLKPWLTGDANQADAAAQLGISEGGQSSHPPATKTLSRLRENRDRPDRRHRRRGARRTSLPDRSRHIHTWNMNPPKNGPTRCRGRGPPMPIADTHIYTHTETTMDVCNLL